MRPIEERKENEGDIKTEEDETIEEERYSDYKEDV